MSEKLTIKDETAAIDLGAKDLWDNFTDEQRKQISFYLLNRYASSVRTTDREALEVAIFKTNEYYNKNFFDISKHSKLLWYLVCMCGNDKKKIYFHEYIPFKKKTSNDKVLKFLESKYPNMKRDELELMAALMDKNEVKQLAKDLGMEDKDIKKAL